MGLHHAVLAVAPRPRRAGAREEGAMLLHLVAEFDLQRDVVPWLAARGWAAALGNAAAGGAAPAGSAVAGPPAPALPGEG